MSRDIRLYLFFAFLSAIIGTVPAVRHWISSFLIDTVYVPVVRVVATAQEMSRLKEENNRLELQNIRLRNQLHRVFRDSLISRWLDSPAWRDSASCVSAVAVAFHPLGVPTHIVLDKGAFHGIQKEDPVLTAEGLAGKIISVRPYASTFMSIYHRDLRVGVIDTRSGVLGVVHGGEMTLEYVPHGSDIAVGDSLVTSGLGRIYPSGLPVAVVENVDTSDTSSMFMSIKVKPVFNFAGTAAFWVVKKW